MRNVAALLASTLLITSIFTSCKSGDQNYKPGYSGSFGELILVIQNSVWKSPIGDSIYNSVGAIQFGLPQDERQFNVIQIDPSKFKSVLKQHRNVFVVAIKKEYKEAITLEKSKWAKGQMVVTLYGKNTEDLYKNLNLYDDRISSIFQQAEMNRHYLRNKKFGSKEIASKIEKSRGYSITTQKDVYLEKNNPEVTWIRLERERPKGGFKHQISQGILLFELPYTDKMSFLDTNIYSTIDSVLKAQLPGPGPNQYMRLNFQYIAPQGEEINYKNNFGKAYRGLWRMENNAMGGPFYLLAFLDEEKSRIVYAFGYVFAPQFEKREYLREVEGMLNSITLK
jgi:hypothetical protein